MASLWPNVLVKLITEHGPDHPERQSYILQAIEKAKSPEKLHHQIRDGEQGQNNQF